MCVGRGRDEPLGQNESALLNIAGKVQQSGKQVASAAVGQARLEGATDKEIHDTVLIAAAVCMFNRYMDGLATWQPGDPEIYRENGKRLADHGCLVSTAKIVGA